MNFPQPNCESDCLVSMFGFKRSSVEKTKSYLYLECLGSDHNILKFHQSEDDHLPFIQINSVSTITHFCLMLESEVERKSIAFTIPDVHRK